MYVALDPQWSWKIITVVTNKPSKIFLDQLIIK